ncbi:MAG: tRNA threonylcarbamoyladenosine dehydratase [Clostridia bacterium]|nr:tRNA threonylcarbamoyladenosine dehydratase [Clostridia bacterium]
MLNQFSRTEQLFGKEGMEKLFSARVAVFGIGGVGSYSVEALARAGVGALDLIDDDKICLTNLNRQLLATHQTLGRYKVEVAAERIAEINPACKVAVHKTFFLPEKAHEFNFAAYDYVIDAVDTMSAKLALAEAARAENVPLISCMGTGNKLDPTKLQIADISKTSVCPLARIMRRELKKRGIAHLRVLFSTEQPVRQEEVGVDFGISQAEQRIVGRRDIPGSTSFVPAAAGLIIAGEVIKDLIGYSK